ncbi:rCG61780, isoform CRA_a [Rattus norvegicus]|uniref:RCG61780, isoform CRA_a n=1 Tax=Rattus norvegicus TaxID=10116 RepID=A6HA06_RAT|nr:rCG61780, isoform CRA_a [Rattus norvegicus]
MEGYIRKEDPTCPSYGLWPQLLQALGAPRSWKALRHSTLEFSPYLPLFASRYIGGTARAFPALVGHSKAAT